MSSREQRTYASHIGELRRMSTWWREWAAAAALSTEMQDAGELCLNEAVANIIQHGGPVRTIEITFEANAAAPLPQTLDEVFPGGLGINIMRSFAARLAYGRIDNRNTLSLTLTR